jgi:hypothetical protein
LSAAVTVYVAGFVKSCATLLVGLTLTPVIAIVGVRFVRLVP